MTGDDINTAVRGILQDEGIVAYTAKDMLIWISAAELETVIHAPKANTVTAGIVLTPNLHRQELASVYMQLLDITHNMGVGGVTAGRPITRTSMEQLQASKPSWRKDRAREVRHFMCDERVPTVFHVWPAPLESLTVEGQAVRRPPALANLAASLQIGDEWKTAVMENVLSRAHSQQSDSAANTQHAMLHYAAFARLVGLKLEKASKSGPGANSPTNPAHPAVEKNGT